MKIRELLQNVQSYIGRPITLSGKISATALIACIEDGGDRVIIHVKDFSESANKHSDLPILLGSLITLQGTGTITGTLATCNILGCTVALVDVTEMNIKTDDQPIINVKFPTGSE
jgi:hypothetical protein